MLQRWGFKREGLSFFQVDTAGLNGLAVYFTFCIYPISKVKLSNQQAEQPPLGSGIFSTPAGSGWGIWQGHPSTCLGLAA